jgi:hypothetical protein
LFLKSISELRRFFDREILPNIPAKQKDMARSESIKGAVMVFLFVLLFVLLITEHIKLMLLVFGITFIVYFVLLSENDQEQERRTLNSYQRLVAAPLLRAIDPELEYTPYRGISYYDLQASKLVKDHPSKTFTSNNLVRYENGGTPVRLSHVMLEHKDDEEDNVPVFCGLFGVTDARRPARGTTIVSFDLAEKHLGFVGQGLQHKTNASGLERIRLDSSGFEKHYVVYSSDPIEANYLLSHTVMEKLTYLIEKYRVLPRISFVGNTIYIAVLGNGFFQPSSWTFKEAEGSINALAFTRKAVEAIHHHHRL